MLEGGQRLAGMGEGKNWHAGMLEAGNRAAGRGWQAGEAVWQAGRRRQAAWQRQKAGSKAKACRHEGCRQSLASIHREACRQQRLVGRQVVSGRQIGACIQAARLRFGGMQKLAGEQEYRQWLR